MAERICQWLNQICPRTEEENVVIKYGMDLLLDNIGKVFLILVLGIIVGKGKETGCILLVFCFLRSQAGGVHAKSNFLCMMGMVLVWAVSLIAGGLLYLNYRAVIVLCVCYIVMIIRYAPCTKNLDYYTWEDKKRKKIYSILITIIYIIIAIKLPYFRTYIMTAAGIESISLRV